MPFVFGADEEMKGETACWRGCWLFVPWMLEEALGARAVEASDRVAKCELVLRNFG